MPPTTTAEQELSYDDAVAQFLDYLKEYRSFSSSTVRAYSTDLRKLREFLEKRLGRIPPPTEIAREQIIQFGVSLRGAAPLTLRRKYACISSFFGFLQDMGHATSNPARRLPLPKVSEPVPVCLTEEMAQQLIAAADKPWYRVLVVLLLSTGIRRAEAVSITLDDIDLENRQLLVRGKGDKQRVVPLTEQAACVGRLWDPCDCANNWHSAPIAGVSNPQTVVWSAARVRPLSALSYAPNRKDVAVLWAFDMRSRRHAALTATGGLTKLAQNGNNYTITQ